MKPRQKIRWEKINRTSVTFEVISSNLTNTQVIGGSGWGREIKNKIEEIMVKKFPNLMKTKNKRILRINEPRHKKHKENHLKSHNNQIVENQ